MSELPEKIPLFILNSNESTSLFITHYNKWVVDSPAFPSFEWETSIINSPKGEDLILGYYFLCHFNPIIDWKNGLIPYDSSGIIPSSSNYLDTAINNVSLVGELKKTYLPSSVHIPPHSLSVMTYIKRLSLQRDKRCWRRCCYIFTPSISRGYGPSSFILS
ncbi:hypothetical protein O181_022800 [Austropuccinia psidii MF-1]|uniref:Uncharacterized protein n=1 Tax=Austropuccinia psidii MF-1 TaxID=1389203 RepID=A0A9Q3GYG9_9BASI|nr:hypothetical protein [Austropuccinia psidii MF-1]